MDLTTQSAAKILGVSPRRVLALIASGRLPARKIGEGRRATYFISGDDLNIVKDRKSGRPKGKKA